MCQVKWYTDDRLVTDATSDGIFGAHTIGPTAGELIAAAFIAMKYGVRRFGPQLALSSHLLGGLLGVCMDAFAP